MKNVSKEKSDLPLVPKIENIHQKILGAVSVDGALDMSDWHTCETTHCRAGWVVTLAGEKGKALEKFFGNSTNHAAHLIYRESSKIKVNRSGFFANNEDAMADIKRCAELERSGDDSIGGGE